MIGALAAVTSLVLTTTYHDSMSLPIRLYVRALVARRPHNLPTTRAPLPARLGVSVPNKSAVSSLVEKDHEQRRLQVRILPGVPKSWIGVEDDLTTTKPLQDNRTLHFGRGRLAQRALDAATVLQPELDAPGQSRKAQAQETANTA